MLKWLPLLLLCLTSPAMADGPLLVFPKLPVAVLPPTPAPRADDVPILDGGKMYVVQSDIPFVLLASPPQLVRISNETGPMKIRGVFADGSGQIETRNYSGKFISIVDPASNSAGRVELIGIPREFAAETDIVRQLLDIGGGPRPPPEPDPGPAPPGPGPTPVATGFRVLFIYETSSNLTREQLNTLHSTAISGYLNEKCAKGPDGRPEWRRWDPDVKMTPKESESLRLLWEATKPQLKPGPQLVIAVNGAAKILDLPATEADTLAILKQACEGK